MSLVVDASVALKWFVADEPDADQALAIVRDGAVLAAPDLVIAEVCNAAWRLARLCRISQAQLDEIALVLPRFFDPLVSASGLAPRAVAIAGQLDHPVYDCLYLALAEAEQAVLVTADMRLLAKVRATVMGSAGGRSCALRFRLARRLTARAAGRSEQPRGRFGSENRGATRLHRINMAASAGSGKAARGRRRCRRNRSARR